MTATKEEPLIYASAQKLIADRQKWHPDADYRWIIGQGALREICLAGVSISGPTPESKRFYEAQPVEWKKYPQLLPPDPQYAQFCQLPTLVLGNIQPEVAILLRDGIPCGAIHCEPIDL